MSIDSANESEFPANRKEPGESHRIILIGGILGLTAALGFGIAGVFGNEPPERMDEALGRLALTIIVACPYILTLSSKKASPNIEGIILMVAALLSVAWTVLSLFSIGLLFLPAAVLLGIASFKSFRASTDRTRSTALIALGLTVIVGSALLSLFSHDDPRCWEFIAWADGRTEWRSMPVPSSSEEAPGLWGFTPRIGPLPDGAVSQRSHCTSNVITPSEAGRGLGLLLAGIAGLGAMWAIENGRRRFFVVLSISGTAVAIGIALTLHPAYLIGPLLILAGNLLARRFLCT
ncbi:MAG: hypothetical protein SVM79_01995 [Chloroflexota bacterium]|nr:hypothetical protein [Chloroflexota bacterium]